MQQLKTNISILIWCSIIRYILTTHANAQYLIFVLPATDKGPLLAR